MAERNFYGQAMNSQSPFPVFAAEFGGESKGIGNGGMILIGKLSPSFGLDLSRLSLARSNRTYNIWAYYI